MESAFLRNQLPKSSLWKGLPFKPQLPKVNGPFLKRVPQCPLSPRGHRSSKRLTVHSQNAIHVSYFCGRATCKLFYCSFFAIRKLAVLHCDPRALHYKPMLTWRIDSVKALEFLSGTAGQRDEKPLRHRATSAFWLSTWYTNHALTFKLLQLSACRNPFGWPFRTVALIELSSCFHIPGARTRLPLSRYSIPPTSTGSTTCSANAIKA